MGADIRSYDGHPEGELSLVADLDLVSHAPFVRGGAHDGRIAPGAWSRIYAGLHTGNQGEGSELTRTFFHTRTTILGTYRQTDDGFGRLHALGTAFTYRFDRLGEVRDRLAIAHLAGPQLQLSSRRGDTALRLDLAAYGDFALVDALVFEPTRPFPAPPPYYTSLQSDGYYNATGITGSARLRASRPPWRLDVELEGHQFWQIGWHTTHNEESLASRTIGEMTATGISDFRAFGHLELGYRPTRWGVAATLDGAHRASAWQDAERHLSELSVGAMIELDY